MGVDGYLCRPCAFPAHRAADKGKAHGCETWVSVMGVGTMACGCSEAACRRQRAAHISKRYGKTLKRQKG